LVTIFTLAGCSTKFAYNNIDWLVYWYIDDYIELTSEQESVFDEKLQKWLIWHKREEFPQYINHLDELISDIQQNSLTAQRMGYHQQKAREHWTRLRAHVAPDLVEMSELLTDDQVVYLFAALEEDNKEEAEEYLERVSYSEEKKEKRWLKRSQDSASDWLGRLNQEQKNYIADSFGTFEPTREHWIAYKEDYQASLRTLFATRHTNENFKDDLLVMITQPEKYRSEAFNQASERNTKKSKQYLLDLMQVATEKQKRTLVKNIEKYKDDIVDLSQ